MIDRTKKGVKPLSATITSTKEISAIEAIFPFFNHLFITPYQVRRLIKYATGDISHISRMFVFAVAGFVIPYVGRFSRDVLSKGKMGDIFTFQPLSSTTDGGEEDGYKKTKWYHVTNHIRQGFLLGSVTNLVDFCIDIIQAYGGIHSSYFKIVTEFFTSASFTIWAMYRMKFYKDFLIKVFLKKRFPPHIVARWKELLNYCLYVITGIVVLDMMGVQYMLALKTISAFGGIGTIVFGLACKEIASQIIGGLVFAAQRPFVNGDNIIYGKDDSMGRVERVGLMNTVIRDSDEIRVKVPNSKLQMNSISNLSRERRSQVTQKLQFTYDTLDIMPELVNEIKKEIELSCPKLITSGLRPLRVYFNSYEPGHLQVIVDSRFRIQPFSEEYYQAKENVMNAIGRAAKKCNARFKY